MISSLAFAAGPIQAGEVELISRVRLGAESETAMGGGSSPAVSGDGRYVVFFSSSLHLVAGLVDANPFWTDLFLHDRVGGTNVLVSHRAGASTEAVGAAFVPPALSADGRYVVFASDATDLVPGQVDSDLDFHFDLFLFDRQTAALTLVSRTASSPTTAGGVLAAAPQLSADGRFVAFMSSASDLVAGQSDPSGTSDVFLFDRDTGTTSLVSRSAGSAATAANGESRWPSISADGRYVAFVSRATNLFAGQTDTSEADVFLYDRMTGTTSLVSAQPGSPTTGAGLAHSAAISADGNRIAFSSTSPNQIAGQVDLNSASDVFLFDRAAGTLTLVSHAHGSATTTADRGAHSVALSGDGGRVAYLSSSQDLVAGFVPGAESQLFLYTVAGGANSLVSHANASPVSASDGRTEEFALAADGSRIAFTSKANDLVAGQVDSGFSEDVFVYDRATGAVALASHTHSNATTAAALPSSGPALSADGEVIVYSSQAGDLEAGLLDANETSDVFAFDLGDGTNIALTRHAPGLASSTSFGGSGLFRTPAMSADGRFVTFSHSGGPLLPGQGRGGGVFLVDRALGSTTLVSHAASSPLEGGNDASGLQVISADGRYIAFNSHATNLVSGFSEANTFHDSDLFLFDRLTGEVMLVSHNATSTTTTSNGNSRTASISGDGRYIAFLSSATDLVPGQSGPGSYNVFLFDRTTGSSTLVSHAAGSTTTGADESSTDLALSRDGRFVAYTSGATNLLPTGPTDPGLYVYDRTTGANTLVSRSASAPEVSVGGESPALSADGRFIAFSSLATNLVAGQVDTNGSHDVFLFDQQTASTALASHLPGAPGATSTGHDHSIPMLPAISLDGRFLAFSSPAPDLVSGQIDANEAPDVFLFDRLTGAVALVSHKLGQPWIAGDSGSSDPALSGDGAFVAFQSAAGDLAEPPISPPTNQVYVYERGAARAKLASRALASEHLPADREPTFFSPQISADGRHVVFGSFAGNLAAQDFNRAEDVFVFTDLPPSRDFFTLAPCRLFDSREPGLGPFISGNKYLVPVHGLCGVPPSAAALSVNVTVTQSTGPGHLTLFAGDSVAPGSSTINFSLGQTRANNALPQLAKDGSGTLAILPFVLGGGSVHVLVDVNGWFE